MTRVAVFSEFAYPAGGGAELATAVYLSNLARDGVEFDVVTLGEAGTVLAAPGIRVIRIPSMFPVLGRYYTAMHSSFLLTKQVREVVKRCDAVYVPGLWHAAAILAKRYRKPLVVHAHGYSSICPTSKLYDVVAGEVRPCKGRSLYAYLRLSGYSPALSVLGIALDATLGRILNRLLLMADAQVFVSHEQRRLTNQWLQGYRGKQLVIYNPLPEVTDVPCREIGVGFFGGPEHVKGFHVLADAMKLSARASGRTYATAMTDRVGREAGGITLLPRLSVSDFIQLHTNISVVAIPSLTPEPMPYTFLEALLRGRVVVASYLGGMLELAQHVPDGVHWLVPGDRRGLALALDDALQVSPETVEDRARRNRERLNRVMDTGESVRRMKRVFDETG